MFKQSLEFKGGQTFPVVKMEAGHTGEVRRDTLDGDVQLSWDGLELALLRSGDKDRAESA